MNDQDEWLKVAERLNAFRVIPRLILAVYYGFFINAWFYVVDWFIHFDWTSLPQDQVVGAAAVTAVAGAPTILLGILTKILKDLTQSYWHPTGSTD